MFHRTSSARLLAESPFGTLAVVDVAAWPAHRRTGWTLLGTVGGAPQPGPRHARRLAAETAEAR